MLTERKSADAESKLTQRIRRFKDLVIVTNEMHSERIPGYSSRPIFRGMGFRTVSKTD